MSLEVFGSIRQYFEWYKPIYSIIKRVYNYFGLPKKVKSIYSTQKLIFYSVN